jgi:hypothetical protein
MLDLLDANGATVASAGMVIEANAQMAAFLSQIPGFELVRFPFKGLLRVSSSTPVSVAGLRSRYNERGDFLIATTPPVPENSSGSTDLFFPHFADSGSYTTQFIMFSGGSGSAISGSVRFLSQNGQPLSLQLK